MTTHLLIKPAQVRQGDVLIMPVKHQIKKSDIGELIKEDKNWIALAYGEATNHLHGFNHAFDVSEGITEKTEMPIQLFELSHAEKYVDFDMSLPDIEKLINTSRYLKLKTRSLLRHGDFEGRGPDHDPHSMPTGDYVVIVQHEGDELEEIRRVTD